MPSTMHRGLAGLLHALREALALPSQPLVVDRSTNGPADAAQPCTPVQHDDDAEGGNPVVECVDHTADNQLPQLPSMLETPCIPQYSTAMLCVRCLLDGLPAGEVPHTVVRVPHIHTPCTTTILTE